MKTLPSILIDNIFRQYATFSAADSMPMFLLQTLCQFFTNEQFPIRLCAVFQIKDHTFRGHSDSVDQLTWHPSHADQLATASGDKTVRLWDARSQKLAATIPTKGKGQSVMTCPIQPASETVALALYSPRESPLQCGGASVGSRIPKVAHVAQHTP